MTFNRNPKVGLISGLLVFSAAGLAGCSWLHGMRHHSDDAPVAASAPQTAAPAEAGAPAEETATEAAISRPDGTAQAASASATPAGNVSPDVVNPTAPKRYTVKRGDTLWGIASMFLRDPWLWPEVWYVNPQVQNPHLIYPGDVLALAYGANGSPQIRLEEGGAARLDPRLRSSPLESAIPTIPYSAVASFLSRPSLASNDEVSHAPHVLAFRDEHQTGGTGNEIYIRNHDAPTGTRIAVVHIADRLRHPDDGDRAIGYEGVYTATAVIERAGNPAKALLIDSARETLRGDCLFPDAAGNPLNFVPRAPGTDVKGRIISVVDDVHSIGQYDIVAINRGKRLGVEPGTVLAVDEVGEVVSDRGSAAYGGDRETPFQPHVRLPNERTGTVLVFKSYDRMSYALVVGASGPMKIADVVRNP
jgi:LysM repeat protein